MSRSEETTGKNGDPLSGESHLRDETYPEVPRTEPPQIPSDSHAPYSRGAGEFSQTQHSPLSPEQPAAAGEPGGVSHGWPPPAESSFEEPYRDPQHALKPPVPPVYQGQNQRPSDSPSRWPDPAEHAIADRQPHYQPPAENYTTPQYGDHQPAPPLETPQYTAPAHQETVIQYEQPAEIYQPYNERSDQGGGYEPSHGAPPNAPQDLSYMTADQVSAYQDEAGQVSQQNFEPAEALPRYEPPYHQMAEAHQDVGHGEADYGEDPGFFEGEYLDEEYPEEVEGPKRGKAVYIGGALMAAIAIGSGLSYVYTSFDLGEDLTQTAFIPPLIESDKSPVKIKPVSAGGKQFPNRNKLIYDRLQGTQTNDSSPERIVSRQEDVLDHTKTVQSLGEAEVPRGVVIENAGGNAGKAVPENKHEVATLNPLRGSVSSDASETKSSGPRKVKTLVVRPDGTILQPLSPSRATTAQGGKNPGKKNKVNGIGRPVKVKAKKQLNQIATPSKEAAPVLLKPVNRTSVSSGESASSAHLPERKIAQRTPQSLPPVTRTAPKTGQSAAAPKTGQSAYVVQVAARRSQTDALAAFADLQQRYPTILAAYRPLIQRANLGSKGVWYRLRVGPMQSRSSASTICQKLKTAGLKSCWVRSN